MAADKPLRIFFSAGEPSGDLHGANLIRQLHQCAPHVEAMGYGGPLMEAAGCRLHADLTALAVMWFLRAVANLHKFWSLVRRADRYFRYERPDAVVLIDYPGFNWWIARRAKAYGIPVFYYVPPQIWAWARWRVKKMRRLADHVLCALPFEEAWFRQHGCNAHFVGHPLFDEVRRQPLDQEFLEQYGGADRPLVAVLPGSRIQEVKQNLPTLLKAAALVRAAMPNVRLAIAAYRAPQAELARRAVAASGLPVEVHVGRTAELIHLATCCMAVSGSVSLELLYHTKPTVILYRVSRLAYCVQRFFRKVKYITLVNLLAADDPLAEDVASLDREPDVASGGLFPEYLTYQDKAPEIAAHIIEWLADGQSRRSRRAALAELKARVAHGGASRQAAQYLLDTLAARAPVPAPPHFGVDRLRVATESPGQGRLP